MYPAESGSTKEPATTRSPVDPTQESDVEHRRPPSEKRGISFKEYMCVIVLFIVNLLNYMDRYTIAGVLPDVQKYFGINDSAGGLISTVFIIVFMIFSPICGYLGDRYNRKMIMIVGILIWILAVLASTFAPPNMFWLFMVCRGIVGIGEASYATLAPTVIADLFTGNRRSTILMIFYFAIPVGSGLGFIVGSQVSALFDNQWQWGVRNTCVLGVICLILLFIFVEEPERGAAERESGQINVEVKAGSYLDDLKALITNPTYITSTFGYTAIVFVVGTMSWWIPSAVERKDEWAAEIHNSTVDPANKTNIRMYFGGISAIGGIVGVAMGTLLANALKTGFSIFRAVKTRRADPIVCGIGALIGIPTFFFGMRFMETNMIATWVLMWICITVLCFNWAINVNLLMEIVPPSRRNSATAWQILCSHLFGDASGPFIVGAISDSLANGSTSPEVKYRSLVSAFFLPNVILILSVVLYTIAALVFSRDKKRFEQEMGVKATPLESTPSSSTKTQTVTPNAASPSGKENQAYVDN